MELLPPQVLRSIGHNNANRVKYLKCSSPLYLSQATYAVGSLGSIFLAKKTKRRQLGFSCENSSACHL